jgi:hypothetical protein
MKILMPCALLLVACSRVNVYTSAEKPQPPIQTVQIPQPPPPSIPPRLLSPFERSAEIEKELAAPLTGHPDDSDRRAQLRAERDALTGRPSHVAMRLAPPAPAQNRATGIIVARDSQGEAGRNRLGFQGLTPSEKKDYFKTLRLSRPDILIEDRR